MYSFCRIIYVVFGLIIFFPIAASAAFKSSKDVNEYSSNPAPLADDVSLPMPCGDSFILRGVSVPAGALIQDRAFIMGLSDAPDDRQVYEKQFIGHIGAPFTFQNLPAQWQKNLSANKANQKNTWYFIGKYELTNFQWQSVMDAVNDQGEENPEACPSKNTKNANLPVSGISWFEAQDFLNKYNAWLVKNHPKSLPAFQGTSNIAFLRLPTEEEWEYAARGGANVPLEWWESNNTFPVENGKNINDYGIFYQGVTLKGPSPIGKRNANPLGLHDTMGNVREMVDGFFHMSIADMRNGQVERRRHGSAGGMLTKGGSFRDKSEDVMPGKRDEMPLYTINGPSKPDDMGLRLVLAGINVPGSARLDELRNEEKKVVLQEAKKAQPKIELSSNNPIEAIDAIAKTSDENTRSNLQRVKGMLQDMETAQASENTRKLEHSLRSMLYQAETLRAFAYRCVRVNSELDKIKELMKENLDKENMAKAKKALQDGNSELEDFKHTLIMGANYYKNSLGAIYEEPNEELDRLLAQIKGEYKGKTIFDQHMSENIAILTKYLAIARKKGLSTITQKDILKGIIPESHYKKLKI